MTTPNEPAAAPAAPGSGAVPIGVPEEVGPTGRADVRAAGEGRRSLRRTIAYALLLGYAFLMLIPFAWQVITSFKTNRDALRLTIIPDPFTLQGWEKGFLTLDPSIPQLFLNSVHHRRPRDALESGPRQHGRLRVRPVAVPASRGAVHRGPRDADDPGPAPLRARLPDRAAARADHPQPGQLHRRRADPGRRGPAALPDAPVLPLDPEGPGGGGQDRRRGLRHDVPADHAAARRARPSRRSRSWRSREHGTGSSGRS